VTENVRNIRLLPIARSKITESRGGLVVSGVYLRGHRPGFILQRSDFSPVVAELTPSALEAMASIVSQKNAGCEIRLKLYLKYSN